jgi:hypothetical protein
MYDVKGLHAAAHWETLIWSVCSLEAGADPKVLDADIFSALESAISELQNDDITLQFLEVLDYPEDGILDTSL